MRVRRTLPQRRPLADRRLVLRRPLRPRRRRRHRRHGGPAAPAHRAADGELAVHRRGRAPRQRRPPRDGAARRGQPDDRRPRHQPLRGLDAPTTTTLHGAQLWVALPDVGPLRRPRLRPPRAGPGHRRRLRGPGVPRLAARRHLAGPDVHARCSAPSCCSTPAPRWTSTSTRPSSTASSSTPASSRRRRRDQAARARLRPARLRNAHARGRTTSRAAAAPRRPAVRRGDRDVVELRRPHPRGGRRLARGVAGPARRRRATPTAGSASRSATSCRRSPRRRCPTRGSRKRDAVSGGCDMGL